jgi:hypothetical protein
MTDLHQTYREQLALRAYGELDDEELRALAQHLEACADCRAFAVELERALSSLSALREVPRTPPAGWLERTLSAARREALPRGRLALAAAFAAGLAAGVLLMAGLSRQAPDPSTVGGAPSAPSLPGREPSPLERALAVAALDEPPPPATTAGISRLRPFLRH